MAKSRTISEHASTRWDVVVVGAGIAGLTATSELIRSGLKVLCVEALGRVGGRILTIHDPLAPIPIELGAEFIHGRSPELWKLIDDARLTVYQRSSRAVYVDNGKFLDGEKFYRDVDKVIATLGRSVENAGDESFSSFLKRLKRSPQAKRSAISYVEGFNAADRDIIGTASIAEDTRAADEIDGDSSFCLLNGYDSVPLSLVRQFAGNVRLNSIVERIEWKPGSATVRLRSALDGTRETLQSRGVIVTVPLGVLQSEPAGQSGIQFDPEPREHLDAACSLCFGHVFRITFRFERPFWEDNPKLSGAGFIFSKESVFPTWWTALPVHAPTITGWSAGPAAEPLLGKDRVEITRQALASLSRILGVPRARLVASYLHDWWNDVYFRGAYSYVPAGGLDARKTLARPVSRTIYFSGEATDLTGHSATVHGAMAAGMRTARQVLRDLS